MECAWCLSPIKTDEDTHPNAPDVHSVCLAEFVELHPRNYRGLNLKKLNHTDLCQLSRLIKLELMLRKSTKKEENNVYNFVASEVEVG